MLIVDSPVGLTFLQTVTTLLQRRRQADPEGEVWEAADLQWWWPRHPHDDPANARFWRDGDDPIAGVVVTRWTADRAGCDVIADADFEPAWAFAARRSRELAVATMEMALPEDDEARCRAATDAGFARSDQAYAVAWLDPAARRAPRRPMPQGYRIAARSADPRSPHWMARRSGDAVEHRLRQCTLYDPALDLALLAPDDSVAGYGLFWPDPVTGVGLVEPMRVEEEHAGRGLGGHLLDAGLRGLSDRGCTRLKVSWQPANTAAVRLYTGAGFVSRRVDHMWSFRGQ